MATNGDIEDMLARSGTGDRAAFAALYTVTAAKLFGVVLHVLRDRAEAEAALQEVYVKIWHNADRYRATGLAPMTWLITIARNHAIDRLRARRPGPAGIDDLADLADLSPGPEVVATAGPGRARIDICLDRLPEDRAEALRRAYLMGETYAELSQRYGVPPDRIRTWLRRALITLRACLS